MSLGLSGLSVAASAYDVKEGTLLAPLIQEVFFLKIKDKVIYTTFLPKGKRNFQFAV